MYDQSITDNDAQSGTPSPKHVAAGGTGGNAPQMKKSTWICPPQRIIDNIIFVMYLFLV